MFYQPRVQRFVSTNASQPFNYFAGWQYLFQPAYRKEVHERWQGEGRTGIAIEVLASIIGMGFTGMVAAFALMSAWSMI